MNSFKEFVEIKLREFEKSKDLEGLGNEIASQLRDSGVSVKSGWVKSQLNPALEGVIERSLGENSLAALKICSLLQNDFNLPLIEKGIISTNSPEFGWMIKDQPKPKSVRLFR